MLNFFGEQLPAEQAIELGKYLSELSSNNAVAEEVESLVASNLPGAVEKLIAASAALFSLPEGEIEGPFNTIIYLLRDIIPETAAELIVKLCTVISTGSDKYSARMKVLSTLYNNLESNHPSRFYIYHVLVQVAGAGNKIDALIPQFAQLDNLIADWQLVANQKQDLYRSIYLAAKACNNTALSREYLVTYLKSFDKAEASTLATVKQEATQCLAESIAIPDMYQLDSLLDLDAVNQLKGDKIYELLLIFIEGDVKAWKLFLSANQEFVNSLGLNVEDCLRKIRLLTLTSLAFNVRQVSFSAVTEGLDIPQEETEIWIIDAVTAGLIDGRMDQNSQRLLVRKAMGRTFTAEHWKSVDERLDSWVENMIELKKSLHNVRDQKIGMVQDRQN